jgi:hypothetical protein
MTRATRTGGIPAYINAPERLRQSNIVIPTVLLDLDYKPSLLKEISGGIGRAIGFALRPLRVLRRSGAGRISRGTGR